MSVNNSQINAFASQSLPLVRALVVDMDEDDPVISSTGGLEVLYVSGTIAAGEEVVLEQAQIGLRDYVYVGATSYNPAAFVGITGPADPNDPLTDIAFVATFVNGTDPAPVRFLACIIGYPL